MSTNDFQSLNGDEWTLLVSAERTIEFADSNAYVRMADGTVGWLPTDEAIDAYTGPNGYRITYQTEDGEEVTLRRV